MLQFYVEEGAAEGAADAEARGIARCSMRKRPGRVTRVCPSSDASDSSAFVGVATLDDVVLSSDSFAQLELQCTSAAAARTRRVRIVAISVAQKLGGGNAYARPPPWSSLLLNDDQGPAPQKRFTKDVNSVSLKPLFESAGKHICQVPPASPLTAAHCEAELTALR